MARIRNRGAIVDVAAHAVRVDVIQPVEGAWIADVSERVAVRVGLVGIRGRRAVVAEVALAVGVPVELILVRDRGTVVARVAESVPIAVGLIRVRDRGTIEIGRASCRERV